MSEAPDRNESAAAANELAGLLAKIEQARAQLARLQQGVVAAEHQLSSSQAAQLVEVNAKLLSATLRAQTQAETSARELEDASRSADRDALTELPNRALLLDRCTHAIANAKRHGTHAALLFLDLVHFKQVNDTLGHAVGDEVLRQAAQSIASSVREADTVGRHGDDEFLILLDQVSQASDAAQVADRVIAALGAPHHAGGQSVRLQATSGISHYPDHGEDVATLIERADAQARQHGIAASPFPSPGALSAEPAADLATIRRQPTHAEHEQRHAQQREANEQLVLAALSAQDLQAAAESAQRRQTEFLAMIAHELRNPLTPIRAAAELLGQGRADETLLPRLQGIIERQVGQMTRLVGDLLDVSRVSTGKMRLEHRPLELVQIIEDAVAGSASGIATRHQTLSVELPSRTLALTGDPGRLTQVFGNLLDNASKYSPGGGAIVLSAEVVDDDVVVTVSDDGIGMTAELLQHVFDPFVQETHATDFNGAGLGIGLTVVRELVQAHGGNVVATSAGPGMGSRFHVTLPLAASVGT